MRNPLLTLSDAISRHSCIDNQNIHNTLLYVFIMCAWWYAEVQAKRKI